MRRLGVALGVVGLLAACSGEAIVPPEVAPEEESSSSAGTGSGSTGSGSTGSGSTGSGMGSFGTCADAPPDGAAQPPAAKAYSGGTCPSLQNGVNTLATASGDRQFILVVPQDLGENERLPVSFLWHWLGGSASDFLDKGEVQAAVDQYRFIAVIPESKDDTQFKWPFSNLDSDERMELEFQFFDDMFACVSEQFGVNPSCVSSVGVSAGALFTAQLAGGRGEYLSSILVLSGGVGGSLIKEWKPAAHKMPAMVLWGGEGDNCFGIMNFVETSHNLETALTADGHFMVECVHNCGHAEPPLQTEAASTKFDALWQFVLDHPYWLQDGASPYQESGVPALIPEWCSVGMNSAVPREGECVEASGC